MRRFVHARSVETDFKLVVTDAASGAPCEAAPYIRPLLADAEFHGF